MDYQSPDVSKTTDLKDMKADEDYTTTVYVANKSDDGKTADLVYVLKKEIPTYDNTITGIMLIVIVVVDALTQRRSIEMARRKRLLSRTAETAAEGECHQA